MPDNVYQFILGKRLLKHQKVNLGFRFTSQKTRGNVIHVKR